MIVDFTQRWTKDRKPVYKPLRDYFNPRDFEIEAIDELTAKDFIISTHYAKSYPAARRRFGLFERGVLVGAAVYSHPMSEKVITNVFECERASDGLELSRLCLTDAVLSNAESFFVAECHRRLKKEKFVGVVSFSDDISRTTADGEIVKPGHIGYVYQSLNSAFMGRSTPTTMYLLPDGTVFSKRTISKIRNGERGWFYGSQILESYGASKCPEDSTGRREWVNFWLDKLTRKVSHPGNLRYGWSFSRKQLKSLPYPKIRYKDVQQTLDFGLAK